MMIRKLLLAQILCFLFLPAFSIEVKDSTVFGRKVYLIKWLDNHNKLRRFALVKQSSQDYVGTGQYITYYDGNTEVVITPVNAAAGALNAGFGSTTHHDNSEHHGGGTLNVVFISEHHAIFEWKHTIDGAYETVTYTFMDGHDYFQWQNTVDVRAGTTGGDSRGPYCTMKWDGVDFSAAEGVEYGAAKYFYQPVYNGPWTFSGTCDIPFCREWDNNREVGYVQTQTFNQQLAGNPTWGGSLNLNASGDKVDGGPYSTVTNGDNDWAFDFQMNFYDKAKKITWGMPYGYMNGGNKANAESRAAGTKDGWGQYSLSIIFDSQAQAGVYRVRDENRAIHNGSVSLSAIEGVIVTTGPVGTANPAMQTLSPAGFDHNYRTFWVEANASGNSEFTFKIDTARIQNPVFRIKKTGTVPRTVMLNSVALTEGKDYYASHNPRTSESWITILREMTGTNTICFKQAR
jgi:hypothetical protein